MQHNQRTSVAYPIDEYKSHLLYLLEKNQILIVIGETGSGKSTRIPQFLISAGIFNEPLEKINGFKQICITQPRRVAASQLAQRVSQELRCELGTAVGYAVRFKDVTSEQTMIKYMTEGLVIREMISDPLLTKYSVIIIDEVHERNLNTDILLGLLKCVLYKRRDLKLIICSATPNIKLVQRFFTYQFVSEPKGTNEHEAKCEPAVLYARGKRYPLKIFHKDQPVPNYLDAAIETVKSIHETSRLASGKILIFLTGQDEVEYVCARLHEYSSATSSRLDLQQLLPLPLHASLKSEEIDRAFDEHGRTTRVCIAATNIAETSLTISGVAHVIDCGFMKFRAYDYRTGTDTLVRVPISKSSAKQRAGRAGRTRDGSVYRLYPKSQYDLLNEDTRPEIQRSPLMETVMILKAFAIDDVSKFPLISKMPKANLVAALELLYALQVIDEQGNLTTTGQIMAKLNLDPRVSKFLVSLESAGCTQEACKIAAVLQVKDIFTRFGRNADELWSNVNLVNLCAAEGDLISYLNILYQFQHNQKSQRWAEKRNLNSQALSNAIDIADKLERLLRGSGLDITTSAGRTEIVQRSVVSGLFPNAAILHPSGVYKTIKGDQTVHVHPTSVFSMVVDKPKLVVFAELLCTTKLYMRHIMSVDQSMLLDVAPHYYNFGTSLERVRL